LPRSSTLGDDFFQHLIGFVRICHETVVIRSMEESELLAGKKAA
jgi:hypothetical protein